MHINFVTNRTNFGDKNVDDSFRMLIKGSPTCFLFAFVIDSRPKMFYENNEFVTKIKSIK